MLASLLLAPVFSAAHAQIFPGFSALTSPTVVPAISPSAAPVFSPDVGLNCPTPAFTVGGFGANADNWVDYPEPSNIRSGLGNYGVVAGLTVPFGGKLSRYCRDYAAGLLKRQEADASSRNINNQVGLLNNCLALKDRVNFHDAAFDAPEFASLRECRLLKTAFKTPSEKQPATGAAGLLETTPKRDIQLTYPVR